MELYKSKFRIKSSRLAGYDYSEPNWYYVTINTRDHIHYFGKIVNEKMVLNDIGLIAEKQWLEIPIHYPIAELDEVVIMSNHVHGIIIITEKQVVRKIDDIDEGNFVETGQCPVSTPANAQRHDSGHNPSLANIVGSYKSAVTNNIHKLRNTDFEWQTRYYDRIIRNEKELYYIRKYIQENPLKWAFENESTENLDI